MTTADAPAGTTSQATVPFDAQKAEAFGGKMLDALNGSALAVLAGVGHQVGLFDTLAELPPSTSEQIARAAGLSERYVREILGGLVLARAVDYDPAGRTYSLPVEHAALLTRAAGPDNLAFMCQYVALIGTVEQQVVDAVRNGGGVPYSAYPRFQPLQREETSAVYDATLLQRTVPGVPGLQAQLERGIEVADFGCGSGHAINLLAQAFPNSRFTGYDFSAEGIERGRAESAEWGLTNTTFEVADIAKPGRTAAFDLITAFDSIHDQAAPRTVLANIRRALRPGGTFLMVDIAASSNLEENLDHPLGATLSMFSVFHCMTVSLAQGGEGLGTLWGEQKARELLAEAGFGEVETMQIEGDMLNTYFVVKPA